MLKSLFGRKEKETRNYLAAQTAPFDITCPYCFKKFTHEHVHFRGVGDSYPVDQDKQLYNWRKQYKQGGRSEFKIAVENIDESFERKYSDDVLMSIKDTNGNELRERLCPSCHNTLPTSAGKSPILIVSVIGTTSCGKSVYMSSLINKLKESLAVNFKTSMVHLDQHINTLYNEKYYVPMFKNKELLHATPPGEYQHPLIYRLNFMDSGNEYVQAANNELTICFFDIAGEDVINPQKMELMATHIKNSNAFLFLVDPSNLDSIRERLTIARGMEYEEMIEAMPIDVIVSLYQNFIYSNSGNKTNIPTAVVLTKSDRLKSLSEDGGEYLRPNSNIFNNYSHKDGFNMEEFNNINGEVEKLVTKLDPALNIQLNAHFGNKAYFAVSALGKEPTDGKVQGAINALRVEEPVLWLLQQKGFIQ